MWEFVQNPLPGLGPEALLLMALGPVFLLFIGWEAWASWRRKRDIYSLPDMMNNAALAVSHQAVDALAWSAIIGIYFWLYSFSVWEIHLTVSTAFLLFLGQDFLYYWFHRASHRIRWLWAAHVVHHSSERLNLSTAFRQSLMYPVAGMWVFWLPLALVGFHPHHILLVVSINLAYQFFVHTQAVGKLGPLEWVFNTPSHHRAHHARNPRYIDRNYGGVLIIWDRLFGTFVEETADDPPDYGIRRQIRTDNPISTVFHEWRDMLREAARPGPWSLRLAHLWKPPEWERPRAEEPSRSRAVQ